ncbi:MAG: hypothetical protein CBC29_04000 [Methylococcaceae bacterium TMED69]|nr:MAG: hypothetical protein CBC29_04000 [Methylococcaceae bacterium TMED69]|tara:strand:- start:3209 stop:4453 length:1245 start_codon:yes stop_codon:yes gene_type:complete
MLAKHFRYSIYFITITLLISSCSSNRAPVFEKRLNEENKKFDEKATKSKGILADFSKDKLVSRVNNSFLPKNIGIILPFDSAYENISKSIIYGMTEAYYSSPRFMANTKLFFYPSDAQSSNQISQSIKKDRINFLIGPLRKENLSKIMGQISSNIDVLNLNINDSKDYRRKGFFRFSLNPEEEARQVAKFARTKGARAIIIAQDSNWGQRISKAYLEEWSNSHGEILDHIVYDPNEKNFSEIITKVLHIDESHARKNMITKLIQKKIKFEARRRQDIDVILLAMDHENARQIIPQLRFHKAEKLPVFAGSRAFAFTQDVSFYKDLDGLYFLDVPMLNNNNYLFKATTESHYPRLFAFGYDALNLIPYLYQMERNEFLTYPGKTGYLRVNDEGIVIRNLNKYRIKNGKVKLAKMD